MRITDRSKYAGLAFSLLSLAIFIAGYQTLASFVAITGVILVGFAMNKSGWLFALAAFFTMATCAFLTDYPYRQFPAASIFLPLLIVIMQLRGTFFSKMTLQAMPFFELVGLNLCVACFFVSAFFAGYHWNQYISGGFPAFLYIIFSLMVHSDRVQALKGVSGMNTVPGRPAPDFELSDQYGQQVSLNGILRKSHALLIFVRGDWCPTCHLMMRGYLKNKEKFLEKNVRVVGIGPDPIGINREMMTRIDPDSLMLSDSDQRIAATFSGTLQDNNPITKKIYQNGIPLPASFLVHQNGNIIFVSRSDRAAEVLQPDKIFEILETI